MLADAGLTGRRRDLRSPDRVLVPDRDGSLHLAICAEYDALPGIGHACGHNIIAATRRRRRARAGAARRRSRITCAQRDRHPRRGRRRRQGLPARARRLRRRARGDDGAPGALRGPHAAGQRGRALRRGLRRVARRTRRPRPSSAINAADAFTVAQVAIGLLRQHLRPGDQVHGIITHGGRRDQRRARPHRGLWMVRAPTIADLAATRPRVERCFEAGALATGATLDDHRRVARRTRTWSTTTTSSRCTGRTRSRSAADSRRRARDDVLDRHGQRLARDALDPPVHRDRERRRGEPSARVRGARASTRRPTGPCSKVRSRWRGPRSTRRPDRCAIDSSRRA